MGESIKSQHEFWHVQAWMLRPVSRAPDVVSCSVFPKRISGCRPKGGKVTGQKWEGSNSDETHAWDCKGWGGAGNEKQRVAALGHWEWEILNWLYVPPLSVSVSLILGHIASRYGGPGDFSLHFYRVHWLHIPMANSLCATKSGLSTGNQRKVYLTLWGA